MLLLRGKLNDVQSALIRYFYNFNAVSKRNTDDKSSVLFGNNITSCIYPISYNKSLDFRIRNSNSKYSGVEYRVSFVTRSKSNTQPSTFSTGSKSEQPSTSNCQPVTRFQKYKHTIEFIPQHLNSMFSSIIFYLLAESRIPLLFYANVRIRPGPIRGAPFPNSS